MSTRVPRSVAPMQYICNNTTKSGKTSGMKGKRGKSVYIFGIFHFLRRKQHRRQDLRQRPQRLEQPDQQRNEQQAQQGRRRQQQHNGPQQLSPINAFAIV